MVLLNINLKIKQMKIQENYFYKLDNLKNVRVIWKRYDKACIIELGVDYPSAIVDIDRLTGLLISDEFLLDFGFEMELGLAWSNWSRVSVDRIGNCYLLNLDNIVVRNIQYIHELQSLCYEISNQNLVFSYAVS
jgi:hypothetical protein